MDKIINLYYLIGGIINLYWFFNGFRLMSYIIKKYPKILRKDTLIESFFSFKSGFLFWKEIFNPSYPKDRRYMMYINLFRILPILFFIFA